MTPCLDREVEIETKIKLLSHLIKSSTNSKVISKNSKEEFDKAREVHNGLCNDIVPNVIVMPTSTNDVPNSKAFCNIKALSSSSKFGRYPPIFSQTMYAESAVNAL